MELPLFEQVSDLVLALTPDGIGELRSRAHRRGLKVWFDSERPPREHYEAQFLPRVHVDGVAGSALEIGFHTEHGDPAQNDAVLEPLVARQKKWRKELGDSAEIGVFFGADNWRRLSEAWIEPDIEAESLAFEVASRLVDYISALQPVLREAA